MRLRRNITIALIAIGLVGGAALPVGAHSNSYCGHGTDDDGYYITIFDQHISPNPHEHGYDHLKNFGLQYDHYATKFCG
jgi:hypothetical protein